MVTWVVERNIFEENCFDRMIKHFEDNGIPYHIVTVLPFVHTIEGKVPEVEGPCVIYGSIGTQKLAVDHGWSPGVWTNEEFNEKVVIDRLGYRALNKGSLFMKLSEVPEYIDNHHDEPFFIKPNTDTKEFAGEVISTHRFLKWYQNMIDIGYLETTDFEVMLSPIQKINMEWRLVVINGKVCECSIYKQYQIVKSERFMHPDVINFVEDCVKIHNPADVFVIDVALTDYKYKIIEYNTFNSAGLYDCDVGNIIDGINDFLQEPCED